jgi:hypothetical protein
VVALAVGVASTSGGGKTGTVGGGGLKIGLSVSTLNNRS